jgi:hypothetical protein
MYVEGFSSIKGNRGEIQASSSTDCGHPIQVNDKITGKTAARCR